MLMLGLISPLPACLPLPTPFFHPAVPLSQLLLPSLTASPTHLAGAGCQGAGAGRRCALQRQGGAEGAVGSSEGGGREGGG